MVYLETLWVWCGGSEVIYFRFKYIENWIESECITCCLQTHTPITHHIPQQGENDFFRQTNYLYEMLFYSYIDIDTAVASFPISKLCRFKIGFLLVCLLLLVYIHVTVCLGLCLSGCVCVCVRVCVCRYGRVSVAKARSVRLYISSPIFYHPNITIRYN